MTFIHFCEMLQLRKKHYYTLVAADIPKPLRICLTYIFIRGNRNITKFYLTKVKLLRTAQNNKQTIIINQLPQHADKSFNVLIAGFNNITCPINKKHY